MNDEIRNHLTAGDEVLGKLIQELDLPEIASTEHVFHDLMSCTIEQQIHYRSSKKTFAKLLEKASLELLTLDSMDAFEEKALGTYKLSGRKEETIAHIAEFFQQGEPDWSTMTDGEVREVLGNIKGVGDWTIDMILLYTLGRADIFPEKDYHLKQIMTQLYELNSATLTKEMRQISANWAPRRSFGVRYLLAWKQAQKRR